MQNPQKIALWYDRLGRLVVSQNSKQNAANKYSYTLYDELGRIKEVGQLTQAAAMSQVISQSETALAAWLNNQAAEQITRTFYDKTYIDGNGFLCPEQLCQKNLRNRVSFTAMYATGTPGTAGAIDHTTATIYSYDIHGNVDTLLQDYRVGVMNDAGNRFKKLVYNYDLISGKVNTVTYQPDYYNPTTQKWVRPADQFHHRYSYDAENRLTDVYTSSDKLVWERDARYQYYKHGSLARTVLGQNQVQGIDYAYTLQGWLKGVNSTSVNDGSFDMGADGKVGSSNVNIARDAYGISLNYFNGDYKPIGQATVSFANPFVSISVGSDLYNGNIKAQVVNIPKLSTPLSYAYKYDQLNRLVAMDAYNGLNNATNIFTPVLINDYKERLSYDPNGNIKTYLRNGTGSTINLNNYSYTYTAGTNRLASINNSVNGQTKTYSYDAIGNTTIDGMQGITNAVWNVYGKLQSATNAIGQQITYTYDASGQRISKTVGSVTEWYVKDASGNTMATYKKDAAINSGHVSTIELYKYGSSLLDVLNDTIDVEIPLPNTGMYTKRRGNDNYILTDGNGNTRVTVSDKKKGYDDNGDGVIDRYEAEVKTATFSSTYGANAKTLNGGFEAANFNGQRKSLEISANAQTAEFWEYNGDVGRRWNLDPKPTIGVSDYATFGGNPILYSDPDGDTLTNPQLRDAAKIANAEIMTRLKSGKSFEVNKTGSLAPLSDAIDNYAEKNQLNLGDFKDFTKNVEGYYNWMAGAAMYDKNEYLKLDRSVINNPGVGDERAIRLTQGYLFEANAKLLGIITTGANVAVGEAAGGVVPSVGKAPRSANTIPSKTVPNNLVPENIHPGQQGKHIIGHSNYILKRSILTANPNDLLKQFHANETTILRQPNANKIIVDFHRPIGVYVNTDLKISATTTRGIISFGKKGAHIIPSSPK